MSTVRGALMMSIAIVSGGFLLGQYLQPDTRGIPMIPSHSGTTDEEDDAQDNSFSDSDLAQMPFSELNRNLQNLHALKKNLETERSSVLHKLVEVDRRMNMEKMSEKNESNRDIKQKDSEVDISNIP